MILGEQEGSSRKRPLEVLGTYSCIGQKKDEEESQNDETPSFYVFQMSGNHFFIVKIVKGTSLEFSAIVWKIRNRINKFVDSRTKK